MTSKISLLGKIMLVSLGVTLRTRMSADDASQLPPPSTSSVSVLKPGVPGGVRPMWQK